jgi:hypothetical protein
MTEQQADLLRGMEASLRALQRASYVLVDADVQGVGYLHDYVDKAFEEVQGLLMEHRRRTDGLLSPLEEKER